MGVGYLSPFFTATVQHPRPKQRCKVEINGTPLNKVILLILLALATPTPWYGATPEAAALRVVYSHSSKPPTIQRVNVVGRYATVLIDGAMMEASPVKVPILVEQFSFGWQALESLNFRCRLESRDLGSHVDALLMRGMPKPEDDRPCTKSVYASSGVKDAGPAPQVEAIRRTMGPLVPSVVVSGNWALGRWYGAGGGEDLFRLRDDQWVLVADGGGMLGVEEMQRYGVPQVDWCRFGIYGAKCH